jgi:hypothetical protein
MEKKEKTEKKEKKETNIFTPPQLWCTVLTRSQSRCGIVF